MSDKGLYIGGGIAVSAALALAIYMRPLPDQPSSVEGTTPAAAQTTNETPAQGEAQDVAAADLQAVDPASADPAPAGLIAPQITNLRVEPDGLSLIAGQTSPLAQVTLLLDGAEIETVQADGNGQFLAYPTFDFTDRPRLLTMVAILDGEELSGPESYPIAPRPAAGTEVAGAAPEATTTPADPDLETASLQTPDLQTPSLETPSLSAPDTSSLDGQTLASATATPSRMADPAPIIAVSEAGVRVVQPSREVPTPEVMSNVALDTISYDGGGDVVLTGRAANSGFLQVYVDNKPVSALAVAEAEDWQLSLPDVDTGVYTLRIDEVDAGGQVLSRIETPFLREDPALVEEAFEEAAADPGFTVAMRTVQPGNTLWAIAEERYGDGVLYVQVFAANADRIRNPDLIYPGQVFELPELGQ